MNNPLIMIVDDSPTNINILANTLKEDYRITAAKSGKTAFDRLKKQLPDLILLDVMMPGMDGFEVCRQLKAEADTKDIPVIFITAMEEAEQKTKGFGLGAVDYITRPFHREEVSARVKSHIALRRMHLALDEKNKIIQRALAEKSRQLDVLISNLPGMVYRCRFNNYWSIEFVSEGCRKLIGHGPESFAGKKGRHYPRIASPQDVSRVIEEVETALEQKKPFELFYRIQTASGEEKWVLEQGVGVHAPGGALIGTEGVISDVTEKQKQVLALSRENQQLKSKIMHQDRLGGIVGICPAMQKVYELIIKAAAGSDNVIIYGPSGTGKELVAKAIHKHSQREKKPFVPINCGAIPENLFESEFFGHKKGAFSGADTNKKGILDMADGGTLFLDELGETSLSMQVKLLRVMDGNGYIPVGGTQLKKPDIRYICATNRDLKERVRKKKMREDFFFRVHIIPITLPPLRERKEDIPLLVEHFINSYPKTDTRPELTKEMIDQLINYSWPGNIRQLQNMLYQFLILGKLEFLEPESLLQRQAGPEPGRDKSLKLAVEEFEKEYIEKMLKQHNGKKLKVAQVLGVDRKTLFRKIKRYGL